MLRKVPNKRIHRQWEEVENARNLVSLAFYHIWNSDIRNLYHIGILTFWLSSEQVTNSVKRRGTLHTFFHPLLNTFIFLSHLIQLFLWSMAFNKMIPIAFTDFFGKKIKVKKVFTFSTVSKSICINTQIKVPQILN